MISYKLTIAYDGTPFFGWQKTGAGPTIQGALQEAIYRMTQELIVPEAASRTDRGVHAEGQVVVLELQKHWPQEKLQRGLNALLPKEIRIVTMEERQKPLHPSIDALGKEYHYRILRGDVAHPIHRLYAWHFHTPLDLDAMRKGASGLLGTHDFSAFAGEIEENPICTLKQITFSELSENRLQIAMTGDRFLYKMARAIAGTLVYIGAAKLAANLIPELIASQKRENAGVTAPAHGLFLHRVFYAS